MDKNKKILKTLLILVLMLVLFSPKITNACIISANPILNCLTEINSLFIAFLGKFLAWSVNAFTTIIKWQNFQDVAVVRTSWTIVRDFVNMFFILILVVIAFGTIFDLQKYSITTPGLLSKIIIAALLINFSLAIGGIIIDISQNFSNVFLNSLGDFAGNLGAGLNINKIFQVTETGTNTFQNISLLQSPSASYSFTKTLIDSFFTLIIIGILLLSMLSAAIFSFVRIPMLWGLLIISPIAWVLGILPIGQNLNKKWWDYFIGWTFFQPAYLFMLVIGTAILNSRDTIDPLFNQFAGQASFSSLGNFAVQDIFFYILAIMILTGGLAGALKVGMFASVGASATFATVKGGIGERLKRVSRASALQKAGKEKLGEIKDTGLPGKFGLLYGGERAERLREAKVAEGIFGKTDAYGRARLAEVNKEGEKIKIQLEQLSPDQRREFLNQLRGRKDLRGEAAVLEYAKQGYSNVDDYKTAVKGLGGENTAFGRQYLENIKSAKLSDLFRSPQEELSMARGEVEGTMELKNLRRELYKDLAKRNQISELKDYQKAKEILSPIPNELKSFIESVKPEYIWGTRELRQEAILNRAALIADADLERKLLDFMKDKKEVNSVEIRQEAMRVFGNGDISAGEKTLEGRGIINEIDKFSPAINIDASIRRDRKIEDLSPAEIEDITNKIAEKFNKLSPEDAAKMAPEFYNYGENVPDRPELKFVREAIIKSLKDNEIDTNFMESLIKTASPKVRRELGKIKGEYDRRYPSPVTPSPTATP